LDNRLSLVLINYHRAFMKNKVFLELIFMHVAL